MKRFFLLILLVFLLPFHAGLAVEKLSLDDCVARAVSESEALKAVRAGKDMAEFDKNEVFWRFFPTISAAGTFFGMEYTPKKESLSIDLSPIGLAIPPISASVIMPDMLRIMSVTAVQPLTSLWEVYNGYEAKALAEEIENLRSVLTEQEIKAKTSEYYYTYLMLSEINTTLEDATLQLARYKTTARNFIESGLADQRAVLQIEIEEMKIEKEKKTVVAGMTTVKTALSLMLNMPTASFEVTPLKGQVRVCTRSTDDILSLQKTHRSEIRMLENRDRALKYAERASYQPLIPTLGFTAGYFYNWDSDVRSDSISFGGELENLTAKWDVDALLPKGVLFFGGVLTWEIGFDWIRNYNGVKKAQSQTRKSVLEGIDARKQMHLQVVKMYGDLQVREGEIGLAKAEIAAAKENLRIEEDKFKENLTTETNLLNANLSLRQARTSYISAEYQYLIALDSLAATIGVDSALLVGN